MKKEKIKTLMMEPMHYPKVCYVEPTRKAFRKAVKADIIEYGGVEAKKIGTQIYVIFNKDRFLADLTPNRRIGDDIIAGTMYVVAINNNGVLVSLTAEQISMYAMRFWDVETFDDMDVVEANLNTLFSRLLADE